MPNLRIIGVYAQLIFGLIWLCSSVTAQQPQPDVRQLTLGEKIERKVASQEIHLYLFELKKGQVLRADFLEKGADVLAFAARDADQQKVSVISNSGSGFMRESLTFTAEQDGIHGIIVRTEPFTKQNIEANYILTTAVSNSVTAADEQRIKAERFIEEAHTVIGASDTANLPQVISKLEEGAKIFQLLGDRYWEAVNYTFAGNAYAITKNYEKAEAEFNKALNLFDKVADQGEIAGIFTGLGAIYAIAKDEAKTKNYIGRATEISRKLGDSRSEQFVNQLNLRDLIDSDSDTEFNKLAAFNLTNFNRQLESARVKKDKAAVVSVWSKNLLLYALNDIDDENENDDLKLSLLKNAESEGLVLSRQIKDRNAEMRILFSLGLLYADFETEDDDEEETAAKANLAKGKSYLYQSLVISRTLNDPLFESFNYAGFKAVYETDNDKLSIFFAKKAINTIQKFRQTAKAVDKESQQLIAKHIEELYEEFASDLISEENRLAEALQVINLGRDQEFYDFKFTENQKTDYLSLTEREAENMQRFDASFDKVAARYSNLSLADYQRAGEELAPLFGTLEQNFDTANSEKDVVSTVPDLADMQAVLTELGVKTGKKHASVFVSADSLQFLLITPTGIKAFAKKDIITETSEESERLYKDLIKQVESGVMSREEALRKGEEIKENSKKRFNESIGEQTEEKPLEFLKALKNPEIDPRPAGSLLYKRIFKSRETGTARKTGNTLENELARNGVNVILWSLRGALRYVPVAALYDEETKQYLVEKYENVMFTRANKDKLLSEPKEWTNGMGFAAPNAPGFERIESAEKEIFSIFGDAASNRKGYFSGQVFVDRNFTKQSLMTILQTKPAFVHIASHFNFAPGDARESYLVLGDGNKFPLVEMQKSMNFQGIDLLTLSACETAAQQANDNGKEIDGFAELAQRLGANSVIATLWKIDDTGSEKLMAEFYRLRRENPTASKSEILRLAQLSLLKLKVTAKEDEQAVSTGRGAKVPKKNKPKEKPKPNNSLIFNRASAESLEHPFYWAPFILFGSSNGGKSADTELFPKLNIKPVNAAASGNSNANESSVIRPSELIGTWEGLFDQQQYFCILEIESVSGNTFYGTLKPQGGSISVSGYIDPATRRINFNEIKILSLGSMQSWTLGSNQGSFSGDGRSISGTGFAGNLTYNWSFSKKGAGGGFGLTANSSNAVVTLGQIESSFKSGLYDETIRLSRIYLQSAPDSKDANVYLGLAYLAKKDGDSALPFLEKAVSLGQPVPIPVKRLREPILGHVFEDVTIVISNNELGIVSGNTVFKANFTDLTEVGVLNYDNQCGIAHLKGIFTESSNKSDKKKQDKKQFNLFSPGSYLLPRVQGNLTLNFAACRNEESYISATIINLIQRLAARQR